MRKILVQLVYNLLVALDQLLNTLLLGHCDETLSSRLGRTIGKERYFWVKPFRIFVDTLFFFDYSISESGKRIGHCEKSIMPLEQQNFRIMIDYEIWSWNTEDSKLL